MRRWLNLSKAFALLLLFPVLLLMTCYATVLAVGYTAALLAYVLETTFTIPWPLTLTDLLPQFSWAALQLQPPLQARPALVLPASAPLMWLQLSTIAEYATRAAAPYLLGFAVLWLLWGYRYNHRLTAALTDGRGLAYSECPPLYDALDGLCERAGLPMPQIFIIPERAANAFAGGLNRATYSVSVTAGLLATLDKEELEAVLAHELSHISNQDVRLTVVAAVMVGLFSWLGSVMWTMVVHTIMGYNSHYRVHILLLPFVLALALPVVIGAFLSLLLKLIFMRECELAADAGAAALTSPSAMASALETIASHSSALNMPKAMRDMVIYRANTKRTGLGRLWRRIFSTHPSFEKRLQALKRLGAQPRARGPAMFRLASPKTPAS